MYYASVADSSIFRSEKVAVIGYGYEGHAHALQHEGVGRRCDHRSARLPLSLAQNDSSVAATSAGF